MGWWERLTARRGQIDNASKTGEAVAIFVNGQPVHTPRRYDSLADQGFIKNAYGFRCTKMIAEAAAAVPMKLMNKKAEVDDLSHPLLKLLASPAPGIGGRQLMEAFYAYLLLEGNTYLEGVAPFPSRPPQELWALRPDRMQVVPGAKGLPMGYDYTANGVVVRFDVDQVTGRSPVMHFKEFHPLNDWYGLSRVEPAAYGIDQHNELSKHNTALVQNGARPSGALIFKPINNNGSVTHAPQSIIDQATAKLDEKHAGAANAGRPMVMSGDIDWKEMGLSPKDGDFGGMDLAAQRAICAGFGVPHELIVPGSSTFNNRAMARLELYEDTVLPLTEKSISALNAWLTVRYGDGLRLVPDLNAVSALEPRRETKRKAAMDGFKVGLLTRNEARKGLGEDEVKGPEGDEYFKGTAPADPNASDAKPAGTPDGGNVNPDAQAQAA